MTSHFIWRELPALAAKFDRILLVPFGTKADFDYENIHNKIEVIALPATLCKSLFGKVLLCILGIAAMPFAVFQIVKHLKKAPKSSVAKYQNAIFLSYQLGGDLLALILLLMKRPKNSLVLYYWIYPFGFLTTTILQKLGICKKSIARGHGSDIFAGIQPFPITPLRYAFISKVDSFTFVHEAGRNYFSNYYKIDLSKTFVHRLGVEKRENIISKWTGDETIRVLSCAYIVDFKRIPLIAESLALFCNQSGVKVHWTHIGGGVNLDNYLKQLSSHPLLTTEFTGSVPKERVVDLMKESNPHLFVHLSRLEGLPVSVMEAMSMGVPCIATSAGGTSELVDSTVGALLPIEVSPQDVANAIREVTNRIADGEDITVAVNSKFSSMIDNEANSQRFAEFLEQQL